MGSDAMQCLRSRDTETMEAYVRGRLSDAEREAFELHVFECDDCASELTQLGALRVELDRRRPSLEAMTVEPYRARRPMWLAVAALVVVALLVGFLLRPTPSTSVADLVSLEAPVYHPAQLRGASGESDEAFEQAMERYLENDYAGAIPLLQSVLAREPEQIDALFFLGASELLVGRVPPALVHLGRVVDTRDVQCLEEALYLRAQARLMQGDAEGARSELEAVVELDGSWQQRAADQLDRLEAWLEDND